MISSRARLRLTSKETLHEELDQAIVNFSNYVANNREIKGSSDVTEELIEKSKLVLKEAWNQAAEGK